MATQVENIKWVPNTTFIVDGFKFQSKACRHYFLSHYHSDHTIGDARGMLYYCFERIAYNVQCCARCTILQNLAMKVTL